MPFRTEASAHIRWWCGSFSRFSLSLARPVEVHNTRRRNFSRASQITLQSSCLVTSRSPPRNLLLHPALEPDCTKLISLSLPPPFLLRLLLDRIMLFESLVYQNRAKQQEEGPESLLSSIEQLFGRRRRSGEVLGGRSRLSWVLVQLNQSRRLGSWRSACRTFLLPFSQLCNELNYDFLWSLRFIASRSTFMLYTPQHEADRRLSCAAAHSCSLWSGLVFYFHGVVCNCKLIFWLRISRSVRFDCCGTRKRVCPSSVVFPPRPNGFRANWIKLLDDRFECKLRSSLALIKLQLPKTKKNSSDPFTRWDSFMIVSW